MRERLIGLEEFDGLLKKTETAQSTIFSPMITVVANA
jgi:hypothetical protein